MKSFSETESFVESAEVEESVEWKPISVHFSKSDSNSTDPLLTPLTGEVETPALFTMNTDDFELELFLASEKSNYESISLSL